MRSSPGFVVCQIEQILSEDPEVRERLFSVLKQYAAEKKVEWLASVLPDVLTTDQQRQLISNIRYGSAVLPPLFCYAPPKWVDPHSVLKEEQRDRSWSELKIRAG